MDLQPASRHALYQDAIATHGKAIARMAAAHEADAALREDLEQEVHMQLWRSLDLYRGQAALGTWTLRVAHNVCADHVARQVRARRVSGLVSIEDLEVIDGSEGPEDATHIEHALDRIYALVRQLAPLDRQVMLLYLEDVPAVDIADITGLSAGAVATRVHRLKAVLAGQFAPGARA